ncbi:MAG: hypothetical protein IE928_09610 [Gammaproteobacteria bacterium]|jgi:hypothetical protein|nr:hypothetical protein [Gammaproteobacteria bacterium]
MPTATLYRSVYKGSTSRLNPQPHYLGEEVLYHGELADALAVAKALPASQIVDATLETGGADYHCNDFARLEDGWSPADVDFMHGAFTVRLTKEALLHLHGDKLRSMRSTALLMDHLDTVNELVRRKTAAGDVIEEAGKRVLIIDASDFA